ncbi:hypothetical protein DOY81_007546 [Sarcophaga bullata]|nr:hypothetical protein DOY81_007546 [Sarcophaga bullata]
MNSLPICIKNYLFITNSVDGYLQESYELCLTKAANGDLVLLLTSMICDFSKLLEPFNIKKSQLNNLVIMRYKSIEEVSNKLLDLHNWSLFPALVVVDLFHLIQSEYSQTTVFSTPLVQKVTLCVVTFLAYLQSIAWQQERNNAIRTIQGLFILTPVGEDDLGHKHLQIIKDLYFYKTETYRDITKLSSLVLQEK